MLRPVGDATARVYFDSISFAQVPEATPAPPAQTETPATAAATPAPPNAEAEPTAYLVLTNGNFEELRLDGSPLAWRNVGGAMAAGPPASSGSYALVLSSTSDSMKWAYQTVAIIPGRYYSASVDALALSGASDVFIRISWYHSSDGSGEAVDQSDSTPLVGRGYRRLTTGPILAPAGVNSARVRLVLRPESAAPASVAFDLASFESTPVPVAGARIGGAGTTDGPESRAVQPTVLSAAASPVPPVNDGAGEDDERAAISASDGGGSNYDWMIALAVGIPIGGLLTAGAISLRGRRQP
jgi:hypothetical protein